MRREKLSGGRISEELTGALSELMKRQKSDSRTFPKEKSVALGAVSKL